MMSTNTTSDHITMKCIVKPSKLATHALQGAIEPKNAWVVKPGSAKELSVSRASLSTSKIFKKPQLSNKMKRFLEIDVGSKLKKTKLQQSIQPAGTKRRYMRRGSSTPSMIAAAAAASASFAATSSPELSEFSR